MKSMFIWISSSCTMAAQAKVDGACQGLERAGFVWEQGFCLHSFDRAKACAGASLAIFASRHPKYWPLPLSQLKLGGWARKTQPGPCWDRFSSTATSCSTSVRMISTMTAEAHCSCPPTFQEGRSRSSQLQMGIMLRAGRARVFKGSCHLLDCLSCYQ